jgi:hypothetical protein
MRNLKPCLFVVTKCDQDIPSSNLLPTVAVESIVKQSAWIVCLAGYSVFASEVRDTFFTKL